MGHFDYHNHTDMGSNIRLIDSINTPERLIDRALTLGLAGIAITDHEALCAHPSALQYYEKISKDNPSFKIVLGNEIYLVDERPSDEHYHYILLAKDTIGHKQLRILSSLAWLNSYNRKGLTRVDTLKSDLERYVKANPGHLIASTACIGGELGKRILSMTAAEKIGDKQTVEKECDAIVKFILWNKELFGDDFYIETQPGTSKEQVIVNQKLLSIANCFNLKMTCTSDGHYAAKEDRYVHKSFLNSKESEREVDAFYADAYLHSDKEMIEKYKVSNFDEVFVRQMFSNTLEILDKIEIYSLFHTQQIPKVEVKNYKKKVFCDLNGKPFSDKYPTLAKMYVSNDKMDRYWINQCVDKLYELELYNETYLSRLEEEAKVKSIIGEKLNTNIFAYPITLKYYIDKFWDLGTIVGAGRGSSCSGLNHWLLGVTQINPVEWNLPFFRYLNESRAELPDIDIDVAPSRRPAILSYIKEERGKNFNEDIEDIFKETLGCTLVATFGTESSKSSVLTACRGYRSEEYQDGIDSDTAQYLSSLIPVERGFVWSISDVYYGNEEKGRQPIPAFKKEVDSYPGLLDIIFGIEGLVSRRGSHASGVIFNDEDPFEFAAYMRTPSGDITTQYDLHKQEWCGSTKYDLLVTEISDKIVQTIKLLQNDGQIDSNLSLREVYDKYLHPNILPIEDKRVWKHIQNADILNLFQFDSDVGRQAAKKIRPSTILELADSNGLMRLTAMETGETPLDKYVRFKNNISLWYTEMREDYHLTEDEIEAVKRHFARSHGVPPSQEQLMTMLMDEDICHFTLAEANDARKTVGKKLLSKVPALKQKVFEQAKSQNLGKYIWECGIGPQMSYSFSIIHALAYSFIGFQTAYLATHWNPIYWNTACLVVNSGTLEEDEVEIVDIYEKEDFENYKYEDLPDRKGKKKVKNSDYAKIAKAIGVITGEGIEVSLVNINTSDYGFKPDIEHNRILYGLKALSNINDETVKKIIAGRPYTGIKDFMMRCPLTKTAMINLIKAGAFDEIDNYFNHDRKKIMAYFISQNCDMKKKLNLQNFNGLIQHNLVSQELKLQKDIFNFNKYLKANKKYKEYYIFDESCIKFFTTCLSDYMDDVEIIQGHASILQTKWEKIYKNYMEDAKEWLKNNQEKMLSEYNKILFKEIWDKYCKGNTSKWEMDSMCFYHGEHELSNVNLIRYGINDYNEIPDQEISHYFKRGNNNIPIYNIRRIAGTVLAKNDARYSISLLTTTGVVNVKFTADQYAKFKRQISKVNPDGTKTVVEKTWFGRGNMLIVSGFKREDTFVCKTYKDSQTHHLYHIDEIIGDELIIRHDRRTSQGCIEEDDYE